MSFEVEKTPKKEAPNIESAALADSSSSGSFDQRPAQLRKFSLQQSINSHNNFTADYGVTQRQTSDSSNSSNSTVQTKPNKTGLPDTLKSGIENLSGMSMDDVKVHANSSKPAEVGAHAYAQGSDIHLASGQEKHLPHEAWHTVQQKQGRVQPTTEVNGVAINDSASLESEADLMGSKAMQMKANDASSTLASYKKKNLADTALQPKKIIQKVEDKEEQKFGGIIKQTLFVLEGESSWVGWLTNSTFTQLKNKIKEYEKASLGQRALLLNDIYDLGVQWYEKHKYLESGKDKDGNPASENETRKLVSVRGIVDAIRAKRQKREDSAKEAATNKPAAQGADTTLVKVVEESEDLQLGRSEDKVGLIAKAKAMLTGKESTFMKIDRLFSVYKGYHNLLLPNSLNFDKKSIGNLKDLVAIANELKVELHNWREKHHRVELPKSEEKADEPINKTLGDHLFYAATRPLTLLPERFGAIESFTNWWNKDFDAKFNFIKTVEANFGYLDLDLRLGKHQNVHFVAQGLALDNIFTEKHTNAFVEVELPNNKAMANGVNFVFTDAGIDLSEDIALTSISNLEQYNDFISFSLQNAILSKSVDEVAVNTMIDISKKGMNAINQLKLNGAASSKFDLTNLKWTTPQEQFSFDAVADDDLIFNSENASFTDESIEVKNSTIDTSVLSQKASFSDKLAIINIKKGGLFWGKATMSFSSPLKLLQLLPIPKDSLSYTIDDASNTYGREVEINSPTIEVNYDNLKFSLDQLTAKILKKAASKWEFSEISTNLSLAYNNLFSFKGESVSIKKSNDSLTFSSASLSIDFLEGTPSFLNGSTATILNSSLEVGEGATTFDYSAISIKNITDLVTSETFNISKINEIVLTKSDSGYKLNVEGASVDGAYSNLFSYDTTADIALELGTDLSVNSVDFSVPELTVKAGDGAPDFVNGSSLKASGLHINYTNSTQSVDFTSIAIENIPESKLLSIIGLKGIRQIILTNEENGYKLAVNNAKVNKEFGSLFNVEGDTSVEINTDAKGNPTAAHKLFIKSGEVTFKKGIHSYLDGLNAKVQDLTMPDGFNSKREDITWSKLEITATPLASDLLGGVIQLKAPNKISIEDGRTNYKTTLSKSEAAIKTSYFEANGTADLSFTSTTMPSIDDAKLTFSAQSPSLPPPIKPFWPINISTPIPVGPFPFEVKVGLFADGGVQGKITDGSISYKDDRLQIGANAGLKGNLSIGAKIGVAAGSSYIGSVGVYGSASTTMSASVTGGVNGNFKKENNQYTLNELTANYTMSGNATFDIKAGAEVTVLYFFQKTLYETKVASWNLGSIERKGVYDFKSKEDVVDSSASSKLLGGKKSLPNYPSANEEADAGKGLKIMGEEMTGFAEVDAAKKSIQNLLDTKQGEIADKSKILDCNLNLKAALGVLKTKADTYNRGFFSRIFNTNQDSQRIADLSYEAINEIDTKRDKLIEFINSGKVDELTKLNAKISFVTELINAKPEKKVIDALVAKYLQ